MMLPPETLPVVLIALLADAILGDPDRIWRRWPHPVVWIGGLIGRLDATLNREEDSFAWRRVMGKTFPAMSVIGVASLVEPKALVEIEAIAIVP